MKMRYSKQRQLVLNAVKSQRSHPTANQLYLLLRQEHPKISQGTVYRNLKVLAEGNEIHHLNAGGVEHFGWHTDPHDHLYCTRCMTLFDAPMISVVERCDMIEEQTGFVVQTHRTIYEGVCADCRAHSI